jgi:hypothetical protein
MYIMNVVIFDRIDDSEFRPGFLEENSYEEIVLVVIMNGRCMGALKGLDVVFLNYEDAYQGAIAYCVKIRNLYRSLNSVEFERLYFNRKALWLVMLPLIILKRKKYSFL